ncbi:hypothetical protein N9Y92_02960, partial [Chlamydiales bacterium]|nr:hypothetical protein [Chlamydiales bacterium]
MIKTLFAFLVALPLVIFSSEPVENVPLSFPEQTASAFDDTLVGGIISPHSGSPLLVQRDLVAKG